MYVFRLTGSPANPVSRFSSSVDDARLHAHARAALRDHDACVRSTPRDAKRNTRSGPRSVVVTPTPLGVSG